MFHPVCKTDWEQQSTVLGSSVVSLKSDRSHKNVFSLCFTVHTDHQSTTPHTVKNVSKFSSMELGSVLLTFDGKVFVTKGADCYQIICGNDEEIIEMFASEVNVFCLAQSGRMYSISTYNYWGQTGTNNATSTTLSTRTRAELVLSTPAETRFIAVYSGYGHSYFLSTDRKIFFSGNTELGQAAKKLDERNILVATEIECFKEKRVKLFASGYAYGLAVFEDNSFYGWGANDVNQLGVEIEEGLNVFNPVLIELPTKAQIKGLSAGQNISLVFVDDFKLFIAGSISQKRYNTWKELRLQRFFDNPSTSFLDAYIIRNNIFVLGTEYFSVYNGEIGPIIPLKGLKPLNDLPIHPLLRYKVIPKTASSTTDSQLFLLVVEVNKHHHFLYKFNEKNDFCDVLIRAWNYEQ